MARYFLSFITMVLLMLPGCNIHEEKISGTTCLMIINVLTHFTKDAETSPCRDSMLLSINELIAGFDPENVAYIKSVLSTLDISFGGIKRDTLSGLEFDEDLKIVNNNIFPKHTANAFRSAELKNFLNLRGADSIIVAGYQGDHSIHKTLIGGSRHGFKMSYSDSAIAWRNSMKRNKILKKLSERGICLANH